MIKKDIFENMGLLEGLTEHDKLSCRKLLYNIWTECSKNSSSLDKSINEITFMGCILNTTRLIFDDNKSNIDLKCDDFYKEFIAFYKMYVNALPEYLVPYTYDIPRFYMDLIFNRNVGG